MPDIHYTMCKDVSALLTWSNDSYTGVPGMAGGSSEVTLLRSDSDCTLDSPTTWMMGVSVGGYHISFSVYWGILQEQALTDY